ncbi:catalase [Nocardia altamirensis]|uniref:catalase n=1 Tax=Nocardia altamirensis TaxID=472158 RepID=UPI0008400C4E|nr:catalase [Nocardia altamirensis]
MAEPSTDWKENVGFDEAERFARQADALAAVQNDRSRRYSHPGRGFHRKALLALSADFDVLPDLPDYARFGLFADSGSHDAWVRISNGSFDIQPDAVPDVRGFAIKVFGVEGPDARDGKPAQSQDFLMIQIDPFGLTSERFTAGAVAMAAAASEPSPERAAQFRISGFATSVFNTTTPFKVGPYAARARILPPSDQIPDPAADQDWGADMYRRLPLVYRFQLQFFVNETDTPIEDATKVWPQDIAPWITVAHLAIPAQPLDTDFAAEVEQISFAPWNALADHRPLGEVNRARRVAMDRSVENRSGAYSLTQD